jgi:hypothetical protein
MTALFTAFGLTLLTSVLCVAAVLANWFGSSTPAATSLMMLIPVAIAAVPFLFQPRSKARIAAAYLATLLLFGWDVVSGFSVGLFYLPATVMMAIAAVRMAIKTSARVANHLDNGSSATPNTFPPARS